MINSENNIAQYCPLSLDTGDVVTMSRHGKWPELNELWFGVVLEKFAYWGYRYNNCPVVIGPKTKYSSPMHDHVIVPGTFVIYSGIDIHNFELFGC